MLTDKEVRSAAPRETPYRVRDDKGLWLQINPNGSKLWRYRYEFSGKEKMLAFGRYPDVSLATARKERDAARTLLAQGMDPGAEKAIRKAQNVSASLTTFRAVAEDWLTVMRGKWTHKHAHGVELSLKRNIYPTFGKIPIRSITAPMVLAHLRKIEAQGTKDLAHRLRQRLSMVFVHAIAIGQGEADPARIVTKAMAARIGKRQPSITDLDAAREMLRDIETSGAEPLTKAAHRLLALTATRPGEVVGATWTEFEGLDGPEPVWRIPAARMKKRREHLVPLTPQAVDLLRVIHPLSGRGKHVFPNKRDPKRAAGTTALSVLLHRNGYGEKHVPHGWRATFSTNMNERFPDDHLAIEFMLAHAGQNKVAAAYNRGLRIERRRELSQAWADLILEGSVPTESLLTGVVRGRKIQFAAGEREEPAAPPPPRRAAR